jgi:hypothetical protein
VSSTLQWLRHPISVRIPLGLRLRTYGLAVGLVFLSVPFLHLNLAVDLSWTELVLHASDMALGVALALVALELAVSLWQRRLEWRLDGAAQTLGLLTLLVAFGVLAVIAGPGDLLPQTVAIRHKHVASGYGDMTLRVIPLTALIAYLAFQALRRAVLEREVEELRAVNRALEARSERALPARRPLPPLSLRHDGGELVEAPSAIVHVQAQENYCEFVLAPEEAVGSSPRPLVRMTLAEALARLPAALFVQTHRSHLVNLEHVKEVKRDGRRCALRLSAGEEVPVARARLGEVRDQVRRHLGDREGGRVG